MSVEPDEVTVLADIDIYLGAIGQRDLDHRMPAHGAGAAVSSFAADGVKPERVDRFRCKRVAQKLDRNRAAAAVVASPEDSMRGLYLLER